MISEIIAPMMLVLIIVLIIAGKMNRLLAAFIGAIIVAFFLLYVDRIDATIVVGFIFGSENSNLHTILFIFGMMIIIIACKKSGVFTYIAFRLVKFSKGKSRYVLIILCSFTFIFSSISMNILCIFIVIPLTITICRILRINPIPFILSEGMVVNTGGLLFVISSIPNILISNSISWSFPEYFQEVGIFSLFLFFISVIFLIKYNEKKLETPENNYIERLMDYDPWMFVASKSNFYKSFTMLIITILSVIILPLFSTIEIDIISLSGGIITTLLIFNRKFQSLWKDLDLELIFYLFCILFVSEAIQYTGILNFVAYGINDVTGGNTIATTLVLLWTSGLLSSVVHNAPITKIFIPVVNDISTTGTQHTLFSAVSIGATLGENLSVMGDNLVLILMVRDYGYELSFSTFMKLGVIISLIQLLSSSVYLVMRTSIYALLIGIIILAGIVILIYFYPKVINFIRANISFNKKSSL
jgi:Na+/H+ antiporter NhaD/arsenite permease-like protein